PQHQPRCGGRTGGREHQQRERDRGGAETELRHRLARPEESVVAVAGQSGRHRVSPVGWAAAAGHGPDRGCTAAAALTPTAIAPCWLVAQRIRSEFLTVMWSPGSPVRWTGAR